jgi:DNA polymerase-3 subunit delta'
MAWQGIKGHDAVFQRFLRAQQRGRLAGSFLFIGLSGIGKRKFAIALAKGFLCKGNGNNSIDPCGVCDSCRLFGKAGNAAENLESPESPKNPEPLKPPASENEKKSKKGKSDKTSDKTSGKEKEVVAGDFISPHPDLYYVSKPPDKSFLPLELLIGDKEHRGQSGLCYNISRTPFLGHHKVAIIDDADFLNAEGANALLKTLEEPPSDSLLILIGTSTAKQLPTIRSRCQIIRFAPLSPQILGSLLVEQGVAATPEQSLTLARRAGGSFDQAKDFFDDDIEIIRNELHTALSQHRLNSVVLAAKLNEFTEKAGKEASLRRRRLRLVFNLALDFFREKMKKSETLPQKEETASASNRERHENNAQQAVRRLERTLDALEHIDRNVNIPFIVDSWCSDLTT